MAKEMYVKVFPECVRYTAALQLQGRLADELARGTIPHTLLLLQHPKTITYGTEFLGTERKVIDGCPMGDNQLREMGFDVVPVGRKGKATLHDKGQLVAYPIVDLSGLEMRASAYVHLLGEVLVSLLKDYGFEPYASADVDHPGVFVYIEGSNDKKIAAIGIQIKKYENGKKITMHGAALNVTTDLSGYDVITPCGDARPHLTSMSECTQRQYDINVIVGKFAAKFVEKFGLRFLEGAPENLEKLLKSI